MHPKRLEINQRLRWLLPLGWGLGAAAIVGLWAAYFVMEGRNLKASPNTFDRPIVWLTLAILATVGVPVAMVTQVRSYVWLIRHGTEVPGRVTALSNLQKSGATPVTFAYAVNGVEHSIKRDMPVGEAEAYAVGTPLVVLVDPSKPKRATVLDVAG